MDKKKLGVIGSAAILTVFTAAGGFTAYRALSGNDKSAVVNNTYAADSNQESVVQAADEQQSADAENESAPSTTDDDKNKYEIIKYTIKEGDTLGAIAKAHGVKVSTITESNGISENDILKIGQEIQFPSKDGVVYKIKSGETLWDIAITYDIESEYLVAINNIESPDKLKIGQELFLPGVEKIKTEEVKDAQPKSPVMLASRGSSSSKQSSAAPVSGGSGVWPVKGTITSKFGQRWGTQHTGIDIGAPTGTDIHAYMGGKVIYSGWNSGGYGYLVKIDHGNGLVTYYAHDSKLLVKQGQSVQQGQVIAKVGSTGDSTGPHCHFEIRKNGVPVNPLNYLK